MILKKITIAATAVVLAGVLITMIVLLVNRREQGRVGAVSADKDSCAWDAGTGFAARQIKHERVRAAFAGKARTVTKNLCRNGLAANDFHILITAYKTEMQLEIHAKKSGGDVYAPIAVYDICRSSGVLGPKRKEGDRQVPEGFYKINRFNPNSNYHLSLGIDYPNASDKRKSGALRLGGDIFIHGACETIGCLPMTDDSMEEIYLYAVLARDNGQTDIPVYIFPFRMTDDNLREHKEEHAEDRELMAFWDNLKAGYDKFINEKTELAVTVDEFGDYR